MSNAIIDHDDPFEDFTTVITDHLTQKLETLQTAEEAKRLFLESENQQKAA